MQETLNCLEIKECPSYANIPTPDQIVFAICYLFPEFSLAGKKFALGDQVEKFITILQEALE